MNMIIRYILNMIPYMLIAIPFYFAIRFMIIKRRKKAVNWYHEIAMFLFILFLVGLASQTIIPKFEIGMNGNLAIIKDRVHGTNLIPFKVLFETYTEVIVNGYINYFVINFLGNIIMFMPIGFFIPLLWNVTNKKVILIGVFSSLSIEFCQLFLSRGTDIDDVILNTVGVCLGLLIYQFLYKRFKQKILKFR